MGDSSWDRHSAGQFKNNCDFNQIDKVSRGLKPRNTSLDYRRNVYLKTVLFVENMCKTVRINTHVTIA